MTPVEILLLIASLVMYLEGLAVSALAASVSQASKPVFALMLVFWPVAMPILAYRTYCKYRPLIQQLHENPLLRSMMGLTPPPQTTQSPLAAILGNSPSMDPENNPFLNVFTEASPAGEEQNQGDETK